MLLFFPPVCARSFAQAPMPALQPVAVDEIRVRKREPWGCNADETEKRACACRW
jgi:hypothetical protein